MNFDAIATAWAPRLLSILRIMSGLLLMQHGTAKLLKFPVIQQMVNIDLASLPGIAGFFELIGGILLVIGLFTRPVAFILSGMTAVAYFLVHAPRGF
jgi:putative oxidoreductase